MKNRNERNSINLMKLSILLRSLVALRLYKSGATGFLVRLSNLEVWFNANGLGKILLPCKPDRKEGDRASTSMKETLRRENRPTSD